MMAIVFGVLLIIVGIVSYVATGSDAITALIPCAFGAVLVGCGVLALNPSYLGHAMHAAAAVGVIGLLSSGYPFIVALGELGAGADVTAARLVAKGAMSVVCLVFVVLCVKSFIDVRKARQAAGQA